MYSDEKLEVEQEVEADIHPISKWKRILIFLGDFMLHFMLSLILNTIEEVIATEKKVTTKVTIKVTINQQKIINAIKENPYVTQEELADILGITKKSITANMKKLQDSGLIKRIGANKNGHWQVN